MAQEGRRGPDRRKEKDANFEGPDRRSEEDRRAGDRRAGKDRRAAGIHPKIWYIAWGFAAGTLPAILLMFMVKLDNPSKWKRPDGAANVGMENARDSLDASRYTGFGTSKRKSRTTVLREELLRIAPDLYHEVKLQGEQVGDFVVGEEDAPNIDLTNFNRIQIFVKASAWEAMPGENKIDILKQTFGFLVEHYPKLTQLVELSFDDGRPNLELRF